MNKEMGLTQELLEIVGKDFLEILERRINALKKLGYSYKKISKLIKSDSILEEFLKISKKMGGNLELNNALAEIKNNFIQNPILEEEIEKGPFVPRPKIIELEKILDRYVKIMFDDLSGLTKEKIKMGQVEQINYFNLKIMHDSNVINIFLYSEIKIIRKCEKYKVFIREDHPGSKLIEIKDLSETIKKIELIVQEIEKKIKNFPKKEKMFELSKILFGSFLPLTNELGLSGKDSKKVINELSTIVK